MKREKLGLILTLCLILCIAVALVFAGCSEAKAEYYTDTTEKENDSAASEHVVETVVKYVEVVREIRVPEIVEVPVIVRETEYVEVPCGVSDRTERYSEIEISPWEEELLARLAWREARGEKTLGMRLVVEVVLNRVLSPHFPNTVYGVIFDRVGGTQFSPVSMGTIYKTPTESSIIAAKICLEGYTISDRILFFMNPRIATNNWISKNRPYAFSIGNHDFYY